MFLPQEFRTASVRDCKSFTAFIGNIKSRVFQSDFTTPLRPGHQCAVNRISYQSWHYINHFITCYLLYLLIPPNMAALQL